MSATTAYARLIEAARRRPPRIALILGSGLSGLEKRLANPRAVRFLEVPGLTETTVPGHTGSLHLGEWAGVPVLMFAGRLHLYEGHAWRQSTQPVHVARDLGAEALLVTNAAGGIRDDLKPGTLMALSGHLECTRPNWWRDLSGKGAGVYDPAMRAGLHEAASRLNLNLASGVYAQMTGPSYETQAEIRALRQCGADAVGMSTAREVQVAHDLGLRCAAISCITNRAAGLSDGPIHHGEVLDIADQVRECLAQLVEEFLRGPPLAA